MADTEYDLVIIGGGPGGYVGAIKAAQLGMRVACIDKRDTLGGTCLNVGCIPSKALLHATHHFAHLPHLSQYGIVVSQPKIKLDTLLAYKDKVVEDLTRGILYLFKKNNVTFIQGTAKFVDAQTLSINQKDRVKARHIMIATGSESISLPHIPIDEKQIVSSTGALSLSKVPEHLVVIGGGYIGLELGSVWQRLGAKVTVIELMDRLVPAMDLEVGKALTRELQKQGLTFRLGEKVTKIEKKGKQLLITTQSVKTNTEETLSCDVVLSCAGRRPYTDGLNLDAIGLQLDDRGRIPVNEQFQTAVPGVYAIGDVIAGPMLAHKAEEEGIACVEHIAGQSPHLNYLAIPAVIYTYPEVATVGHTEESLKEKGIPYKAGKFPFSANSRARANGETDGFVKILSHAQTDEVLGVHIIHADAGTMIAQCALAMEYRASSEDIARTCHAHPTTSEAVKEAALAAFAKPIHI